MRGWWRSRCCAALAPGAGDAGREERAALVHRTRSAWLQQLSSMDHEDDDPGTTWNERARAAHPDRMSPRMAWRAIQAALPRDAIISSDIGNNCAIGNAYPTFEEGRKYLAPGLFGPCGYGLPAIIGAKIGRPDVPVVGFAGDGAFGIAVNELTACGRAEWPAITMVVFRNYQWGAEKRNSTLWFDDNFVGTELDLDVDYSAIARACGLKGVRATTMEELTRLLREAVEGQMRGETTLIEVILNQELGEPFRRDAMKKPVRVAGIRREDMQSQALRCWSGAIVPAQGRRAQRSRVLWSPSPEMSCGRRQGLSAAPRRADVPDRGRHETEVVSAGDSSFPSSRCFRFSTTPRRWG